MTDNITISRELLRQVLSCIEQWNTPLYKRGVYITALRSALDAPAAEPVAWRAQSQNPPGGYVVFQQYPQKLADLGKPIEPLFTAPQAQHPAPAPSWVSYDHSKDELTIYGKRYAASVFSNLLRVGSLLKVVEGRDDVVTLEKVAAQQPSKAVKLGDVTPACAPGRQAPR